MVNHQILIIMLLVGMALAQRPGYAGLMPFGYPVMVTQTTAAPVTTAGATGGLGNRFGEDTTVATTTQRLPLEANNNVALVNELLKLPIDQRPFWLLNWQALDEHRNKPHTWQIRDNVFLEPREGLSDRSGSGGHGYPSMYLSK